MVGFLVHLSEAGGGGHDVRHAGRGSHRGVPVSSGGWRPAFGSWTEGRPSRIDGRHPDDALFGVYRPHLIGLSAEGSGSRGDDSHGAELVHAESARHHHGRHRLHSAPVRITTRAGDHRSLASRTARGVTHGQTGAVSGPATRSCRGLPCRGWKFERPLRTAGRPWEVTARTLERACRARRDAWFSPMLRKKPDSCTCNTPSVQMARACWRSVRMNTYRASSACPSA